MLRTKDIRDEFASRLAGACFVPDRTGGRVVEIVGASFVADEETILGAVNYDWCKRELDWYESKSLRVDDIPGGAPLNWKRSASKTGFINSNYGWMIWSNENHNQYDNVLAELRANPLSRRATMVYTRPDMHAAYKLDGMSDFCCTNAVQYLVRDGMLWSVVQMRSNDAWSGYRNDYYWQRHVRLRLCADLGLPPGPIVWNAASLHFYDSQFYLIDHYSRTGEITITKREYDERYPDSSFRTDVAKRSEEVAA